MNKLNEYKLIYFNPDDTDFEKMHKAHISNIKRIARNIDNKCLSDMLFDRDERLITYITELSDRIDKAIEYLEDKNNELIGILENNKDTFVKKQGLLNILKGEDNEC